MCLTSSDSSKQDITSGDIDNFDYHLVDDHDDNESDKEQKIVQNSNDNASIGEIVAMFICGVFAYPAAVGIHLVAWRILKVAQSIILHDEKHESNLELSNFEMAVLAVCYLDFILLVFVKIVIMPLYKNQKYHRKQSTTKQEQDDDSITKNNDQIYCYGFMNITKYWKHFLVLNIGAMISSTLIDAAMSIVQSYHVDKQSSGEAKEERSFLIVSVVVMVTIYVTSALMVWIQKIFICQNYDEQPEIMSMSHHGDDKNGNKEEESKVQLLSV